MESNGMSSCVSQWDMYSEWDLQEIGGSEKTVEADRNAVYFPLSFCCMV